MARASRTPYVVLGILGILDPRPLSGYDIKHVIDGTISHFWSESFGQIYPVLRQLASKKLIHAWSKKQDGRKKIVYGITTKGDKILRNWLEQPPQEGPKREELILKLFFGSKTEIPVLIQHLKIRRDQMKSTIDQYARWLAGATNLNESYFPFQIMTLRGGIAMCNAFVQWADESLATLHKMQSVRSSPPRRPARHSRNTRAT